MFGKKRPDNKRKVKLKIIFICSSLEPGRDGVGDYTRRIAIEMIRQGHIVAVVSLNDNYISEEFIGVQSEEGIDLNILRLPSKWSLTNRVDFAKKYVDEFDPDWLSLQFVIFGYQRKGLPFKLGHQLARLGLGKQWHVMFHELWLGMEKGTPVKNLIWGHVQYLLIKSLISKIKPKVIHSHTSLYQYHLANLGFNPLNLPLFGNIPRIDNGKSELTIDEMAKSAQSINFILFGHIFPNAPVTDFARDVSDYAKKNNIKMLLTIIGRCGEEQKQWIKEWEALGLTVNVLGEQPANIISEVLGSATFGISTTPMALIEKSGSVAAMHEHGLPVICVPFLWEPKNYKEIQAPDGVVLYQKGNLEVILSNKIQPPESNSVSLIGTQLVNSLLV